MNLKRAFLGLLSLALILSGLAIVPTQKVNAESDLPTMTYWTIGGEPEDLQMVEDAINEYAAEEVGAKIDYYYSGWGDYGDKMNSMLQAAEYFDIAFGSSINGYGGYAQTGMFADLSAELENHPDLVEFIPEGLWTAMTLPDGQIFGIPTYKDSSATQYWVWTTDVIEGAGVDVSEIKELKDLGPALETIKNWDGYEGQYPLFMSKSGINSLFFDYEPFATPVNVKFGTTEAVNLFAQDDVIDRLKTLREYYDAGYINPDANTLTQDSIPKGSEVVGSAQGWPGAEVGWADGRGVDSVTIVDRMGPVYTTQGVQGSFNVVYAASEHVDKAVNFLAKVNLDPTMRDMVAYGIEGTHFEYLNDERTVIQKITPAADKYGVPAYTQGTFFNMAAVDPQPANQWDAVRELNERAETSPLLGFMFQVDQVENEIAALNAVYQKYESTLLTGAHFDELSVEDLIAQVNSEFEAAGLQTVIDEVQRQIDEFIAANPAAEESEVEETEESAVEETEESAVEETEESAVEETEESEVEETEETEATEDVTEEATEEVTEESTEETTEEAA